MEESRDVRTRGDEPRDAPDYRACDHFGARGHFCARSLPRRHHRQALSPVRSNRCDVGYFIGNAGTFPQPCPVCSDPAPPAAQQPRPCVPLQSAARTHTHPLRRRCRMAEPSPGVTVLLFLLVGAGTYVGLMRLPGGFLPEEDQGYFFVNVQLPDAASLNRTESVMDQVRRTLAQSDGVEDVITVSGFGLLSGAN